MLKFRSTEAAKTFYLSDANQATRVIGDNGCKVKLMIVGEFQDHYLMKLLENPQPLFSVGYEP